MDSIKARDFWNSIDSRLEACGENLTTLSEQTGIKYKTLSMQRNRHSLPGIEQLISMAEFFHISLEELVRGEKKTTYSLSKEAKAVEESPELQALVRAVMRDPQLLSALAAVIESSERVNIG